MLYVYSMDPSFLWLHARLQASELASRNDCSTGPKHLELFFFFLADPSVGGRGPNSTSTRAFFFLSFFLSSGVLHVFVCFYFFPKVASPTIVSLPSENCVK